MAAKRKKFFRVVFYSFFIVLWLAVVGLALEFTAFLMQRNIETTNPLIIAYKQQNKIPHIERTVNTLPVPVEYPSKIGGWDTKPKLDIKDPYLIDVLDTIGSSTSTNLQKKMACRERFSEFSSKEKDTYARIYGEHVLYLNKNNRIHAAFGLEKSKIRTLDLYFIRFLLAKTGQLKVLNNKILQVLETEQPQHLKIYLPNQDAPTEQHEMTILPAPGKEDFYVFMDAHPENTYAPPVQQPTADSRWEVPYFRYKRNYHSEHDPSFHTNALGFRSPEIIIPKPKGVFRILCIGGSTTDDIGETQMTFPAMLEVLMKETFPDCQIEVINAGTPGISTKYHLLRLNEYLHIEPDLVVMHLGVNDTVNIYRNIFINLPARVSRFVRLFFPAILAPSSRDFQKLLTLGMGQNLHLLVQQFQRSGAAIVFASMPYPDPQTITKELYQFINFQGKQAWALPAFSLKQYGSYINMSNNLLRNISQETQSVYIPLAESMAQVTNVYNDFCHMNQSGINAKAQVIFVGIKPLVARRLETDRQQ